VRAWIRRSAEDLLFIETWPSGEMSMTIGVFGAVLALAGAPLGKADRQFPFLHLRTGAGHEKEHEHKHDIDHRCDLKSDVAIV